MSEPVIHPNALVLIQLLAGLAFLVIKAYLWHQKKPLWFIVLPALFMLVMPMWAMIIQTFVGTAAAQSWLAQVQWLLLTMGTSAILLELWIILEARSLITSPKKLIPQR